MKSIVEQASTVLKAIEKGWEQAGKPAEFTIKVYEHGVKNFFGMSIEPAKICILFEDKSSKLRIKNSIRATKHRHNSNRTILLAISNHVKIRQDLPSNADKRISTSNACKNQR